MRKGDAPRWWAAQFWLPLPAYPPDLPLSAWDGAPTTQVRVDTLTVTRMNADGPVLVLLWRGQLFLRSGYSAMMKAKKTGKLTIPAKVLSR